MISENTSGFTLIEFLVAIVILMVGMLGLLQSINLAMQKTVENAVRSEAVSIADEAMGLKRAKTFAALSTITESSQVLRSARGIQKSYSTTVAVTQPTDRSKQIIVNVSWKIKGVQSTHGISSIVSTY